MNRCLPALISACLAATVQAAEPGNVPVPEPKPADSAFSLTELLVQEDAEPEVAQSADVRSELALRYLLGRGVLFTPTPEAVVAQALDPAQQMRQSDWLDAFERRAQLARLAHPAPRHVAEVPRQAFDIPLADHPLVDVYIEYFTGRGRWFFETWLARAARYTPLMRQILAKEGLPEDLVYVAMVESGFSAHAYSRAAACGFWQFIRPTGTLFGLRSDAWRDERRDFVRSTEAAAHYLKDLLEEFGDWHLAWAGYNAGSSRIRRALAKAGGHSFWDIVDRKGLLAKETRHYVPKIIAAAIVAKNPERYGFDALPEPTPLTYDEIEVEDATDLKVVARYLDVPLATVRDLNPALLYDLTPPGENLRLRVPAGRGPEVATFLAGLPRSERITYRQHQIKQGDTLSTIANRYGSSIEAIRQFNGIRNPRVLRPGARLIIPALTSDRRGHSGGRGRVAGKPQAHNAIRHVVGRGETLWSIARRYRVSIEQVKSWNRRQTNSVQAGEVLTIVGEVNSSRSES